MRIPLPVDPSLLLMLMTMFVPSCDACRHATSGRVLVGERRRYDVERVFEAVVAIMASKILTRYQYVGGEDVKPWGIVGCMTEGVLGSRCLLAQRFREVPTATTYHPCGEGVRAARLK